MYNITSLTNTNNIYGSQASKTNQKQPVTDSIAQKNINSQPIKPSVQSFGSAQSFSASNQVRTSLSGKDEHNKFNALNSILDKKVKKDLSLLLKNGKLLSSNSDDKTTTLDNLYKIITEKRADGLEGSKLAEEVITTIKQPFIITQKFGDVPQNLQQNMIDQEKADGKSVTSMDLDVKSSTCPAASIEFNLAHKNPAEFARMADKLSSPEMKVTKNIKTADLSQGLVDTIWMLNEFGTEHKMKDWNNLSVTLKPDKNAITRAKIQNNYKDAGERSIVDVLMQSTFMNAGAQNTYDSLVDRRIPKYNDDDSGLIDIEKNFVEELVTGHGKVCVTYQKIDENGKLAGYECEQNETLQHIQSTLNDGHNVIIGYTYTDKDNNVIGGHEITIIGIETDKKGQKYFICNDTDDDISDPIKYPVEELLPKIHHAGIPKSVLVNNVEFVEGWRELMQVYKDTKTQQQVQKAVAQSTSATSLLQHVPVRNSAA